MAAQKRLGVLAAQLGDSGDDMVTDKQGTRNWRIPECAHGDIPRNDHRKRYPHSEWYRQG